jgi:cell cycle checkpoint control protein RAD9A
MNNQSKGVIKTYRLTYESIEVMHALFNRDSAKNRWTISASVLRSFIDYFGPTTEQLDLYSENGRATLTSYTEKIMNGRGVLHCTRRLLSYDLNSHGV